MEEVGIDQTYISGEITAPAHPFTGNWGHRIFFSALEMNFSIQEF